MDYGQNTQPLWQNPGTEAQPTFPTAGIGNVDPTQNPLPQTANLDASKFQQAVPAPIHSTLGNAALNGFEVAPQPKPTNYETPSLPLPNSDPGIAAATAIGRTPEFNTVYRPEPNVKFGQIEDAPMPTPSSNLSENSISLINDSINRAVEPFRDGKASTEDVKKLREEIDELARDENDSENAAKIYEFRRAACEALDPTKGVL